MLPVPCHKSPWLLAKSVPTRHTPSVSEGQTRRLSPFGEEAEDALSLADLIGRLVLAAPIEAVAIWHATELFLRLRTRGRPPHHGPGGQERPYDGVDLVRALVTRDSRIRVIFTGGDAQARRRVYLREHLWHLMRPIDTVELVEALEHAIEAIGCERARPLVVRTDRTDLVIPPRDIRFVESRLRLLIIHAADTPVRTYGNLGELALRLPLHFVRCHKSFLVNLDHVRAMSDGTLVLDTGEEVPVSQRRRSQTCAALYAHFARP